MFIDDDDDDVQQMEASGLWAIDRLGLDQLGVVYVPMAMKQHHSVTGSRAFVSRGPVVNQVCTYLQGVQ